MLGMAAIHLLLHPSYIIRVTQETFSKNNRLTKKARFAYILNFLLLIFLLMMIVSSISISRELFNNRGTFFMKNLHKTLAALMILIVGIHLGLHYKMITLKLKFNKVFATILVSAFLIFGIYSLATTSYTKYLISITASSEGHNLGQGKGQGRGQGLGHGQGLGEGEEESENHEEHGSLISELDFAGVGLTIISYGSIIFVFCFATHLVEIGLNRKRKEKNIEMID